MKELLEERRGPTRDKVLEGLVVASHASRTYEVSGRYFRLTRFHVPPKSYFTLEIIQKDGLFPIRVKTKREWGPRLNWSKAEAVASLVVNGYLGGYVCTLPPGV